MQKLIKLSDTHYIVVDDSEIKEGDWTNKGKLKYFTKDGAVFYNFPNEEYSETYWLLDKVKKITHSTQPLYKNDFWAIQELKLSEVEEAINGYSVEKMAERGVGRMTSSTIIRDYELNAYEKGFNAHKELVKDKLFNVEDVENILIKFHKMNMAYLTGKEDDNLDIKDFINTVLPKTEWECTITPEGKIVIL